MVSWMNGSRTTYPYIIVAEAGDAQLVRGRVDSGASHGTQNTPFRVQSSSRADSRLANQIGGSRATAATSDHNAARLAFPGNCSAATGWPTPPPRSW
jgi:hypothetical protein